MSVDIPTERQIEITWTLDRQWIRLSVDLSIPSASIAGTTATGEFQMAIGDTDGNV